MKRLILFYSVVLCLQSDPLFSQTLGRDMDEDGRPDIAIIAEPAHFSNGQPSTVLRVVDGLTGLGRASVILRVDPEIGNPSASLIPVVNGPARLYWSYWDGALSKSVIGRRNPDGTCVESSFDFRGGRSAHDLGGAKGWCIIAVNRGSSIHAGQGEFNVVGLSEPTRVWKINVPFNDGGEYLTDVVPGTQDELGFVVGIGGLRGAGAILGVNAESGEVVAQCPTDASIAVLGRSLSTVCDMDSDATRDYAVLCIDDKGRECVRFMRWNASGMSMIPELRIEMARDGVSDFAGAVSLNWLPGVGQDRGLRGALVVSAPMAGTSGKQESGAMYVYSLPDVKLLWSDEGLDEGSHLGLFADDVGDINGDGLSDVLIRHNDPASDVSGTDVYEIRSGRTGEVIRTTHVSRAIR